MNARHFLSTQEQDQLVALIQAVERKSSCEIRVHIDDVLKGEGFERSKAIFRRLKMHKTLERNGILLYVSLQPRTFYIIGDIGIDKFVDEGFWTKVTKAVIAHFHEEKYAEGLLQGIAMCGEQLEHYFPYQDDDINELPDEISFGEV